MPFCPQCRTEYRAGIERCADCGATLVAALPEESSPAPQYDTGPDADLVLLCTVEEPVQAWLLHAMLVSGGIRCWFREARSSIPVTVDGGHRPRLCVWVRRRDLPRARMLYQAFLKT